MLAGLLVHRCSGILLSETMKCLPFLLENLINLTIAKMIADTFFSWLVFPAQYKPFLFVLLLLRIPSGLTSTCCCSFHLLKWQKLSRIGGILHYEPLHYAFGWTETNLHAEFKELKPKPDVYFWRFKPFCSCSGNVSTRQCTAGIILFFSLTDKRFSGSSDGDMCPLSRPNGLGWNQTQV